MICIHSDGGKTCELHPSLKDVLEVFFQTLEATTVPCDGGRVICDIPGAVLLSDHAQKLYDSLGRQSASLFKRNQSVRLNPDGSLSIGNNTSIAVQCADEPEGPWTNLAAEGVRASSLAILPGVAKDLAILLRASDVVGFPIQRWNELQARKPGGPHQRYFSGDVITHADLAVLESVRKLIALGSGSTTRGTGGGSRGEAPPDAARHSDDFRSAHWYGIDHTFTANQATVVRHLWEAWTNGTPELSDAYLLTKAESDTKRLADVFRDAKTRSHHPAWDTMIVSGTTKGTRRLMPPQVAKTDSNST